MAGKAVKINDEGIEADAPKGARELRWQKFLENYAQKNPVKFASKKANGEFDSIPDSFK